MIRHLKFAFVVTVSLVLVAKSANFEDNDERHPASEKRLVSNVERSAISKKTGNLERTKSRRLKGDKRKKRKTTNEKIKSMKRKGGKTKDKKRKLGKNNISKVFKKKKNLKKRKKKLKKKKGKGKKKNKKLNAKGPTGRAKADNAIYEGPYGYEHPEAIDWTQPEYRCPDCEDTLIIYDPWYAPPPTLHIPVFCSSNLSEFAKSNSFSNYGPNLTFIFIPGTLNCSNPSKARSINTKQFSIEITQREADEKEEAATETATNFYDCGRSVTQDMSYLSCGEDHPEYSTDQTSRNCFWHFHAYKHWRRQLKFPRWSLPPCADNSTAGECCKEGPHLLISKTGYAKKFQAYCGREAPKFEKSDFDKGKARWLVVYNSTGKSEDVSTELQIESPTIGYRKSAAFDQLYYGERCICGLRKGNKHPAKDPELDSARVKKRKGKKKVKKNKQSKRKRKKYTKNKSNKKKPRRKKIGKREAIKRKKRKVTKKTKKVGKLKRKMKFARKKGRKVEAADVGPQDRIRQVWPWMASITYSDLFTCTGYIISPMIVITTTKCFPYTAETSGAETGAVETLNSNKDLITVIGQDEQGIGTVNPAHYWEEKRNVSEILLHPDCNPVSSPQFCVLALVLTNMFSMSKEQRPRPACMNCQVNSYRAKVLKGVPFLASYGLQATVDNSRARAGSYKAPKPIKSYLSETCITRNFTTSETYCLEVLGERFMCDVGRVSIGGGTQPGKRDYGGLLINRVGRNGYKINFQVVGLLWDYNCGAAGPAEYIPTWPALSWMVNLMMARDKPCTKLIRKSDWTRNVKTDGYYDNGNII